MRFFYSCFFFICLLILSRTEAAALFTFSDRISVRREAPDGVAGDEGIAPAIAEEPDASDGGLAANRKLSEKVNKAESATLHVLIAANTAQWDIGSSSKQDFKKCKQLARRIAEAAHLTLEEHLFKDDAYLAEDIIACIESLNVSPEDVICYFHSSHGVRTYSMSLDELPILDFGPRSGLYLRDVVQRIEDKHPRLTLILADCCQMWVDDFIAPTMLQVFTKGCEDSGAKQLQVEQHQRLFLFPRGTIIILGSAPGGLAYATDLYGSYCTYYLTHTLTRLSKSMEPITWKALLHETQQLVKRLSSRPSEYPPFQSKPQNIWYSIQIDTEEPYVSPTLSFTPEWRRRALKKRERDLFERPKISSTEDKKEVEPPMMKQEPS